MLLRMRRDVVSTKCKKWCKSRESNGLDALETTAEVARLARLVSTRIEPRRRRFDMQRRFVTSLDAWGLEIWTVFPSKPLVRDFGSCCHISGRDG
jgi:hypothetical protein